MTDVDALKAEGLRSADEMAKAWALRNIGMAPMAAAYWVKVQEIFATLRSYASAEGACPIWRKSAAEAAGLILARVSRGLPSA